MFEKSIKLNTNASSGSRVFPCGEAEEQSDGHDEANSRLTQFCGRD